MDSYSYVYMCIYTYKHPHVCVTIIHKDVYEVEKKWRQVSS